MQSVYIHLVSLSPLLSDKWVKILIFWIFMILNVNTDFFMQILLLQLISQKLKSEKLFFLFSMVGFFFYIWMLYIFMDWKSYWCLSLTLHEEKCYKYSLLKRFFEFVNNYVYILILLVFRFVYLMYVVFYLYPCYSLTEYGHIVGFTVIFYISTYCFNIWN